MRFRQTHIQALRSVPTGTSKTCLISPAVCLCTCPPPVHLSVLLFTPDCCVSMRGFSLCVPTTSQRGLCGCHLHPRGERGLLKLPPTHPPSPWHSHFPPKRGLTRCFCEGKSAARSLLVFCSGPPGAPQTSLFTRARML